MDSINVAIHEMQEIVVNENKVNISFSDNNNPDTIEHLIDTLAASYPENQGCKKYIHNFGNDLTNVDNH